MKKIKLLTGLMMLISILAITSCEKSIDQITGDIEGTYIGSFSKTTLLNSAFIDSNPEDIGIAEVTLLHDNQIQVYCFGNELDTTFVLNYFEHNESVLVCLNGTDFENLYGHMYGESHMFGNMMGDLGVGETEWMHHMQDEHELGDEHFGGFDMHNKAFTYSFPMMDNSTPYYLKFHGIKN